ncbi:MAG: helix-turn-helix domain-containing protein [Mucilaginibacter sp.]
MDIMKINASLANAARYDILRWLKEPEKNFPPHKEVIGFEDGVCVSFIKDKSGLSQSTISHYLNMMENAQLVIATRIGKWTYYKRNEATLAAYLKTLQKDI